jgi:copper chaperone CopZ
MKIIKLADSEHSMKEQFETNLNCIIEDINDVKRFYSDVEVDIDVHASSNEFTKEAQQVMDPRLNKVINQVVQETQVPKNKLIQVVTSLLSNLGDGYSMSQIKTFIENSTQADQMQQQQQPQQQTQQQTQQQGV